MRLKNYQVILALYLLLIPATAHLISEKTDPNGNPLVPPSDLIQLEKDSLDLSRFPAASYPVGAMQIDTNEGFIHSTVTLIAPNLALATGHTAMLLNASFLPKNRTPENKIIFQDAKQHFHSCGVNNYFLPPGYNEYDETFDIGIIKLDRNIMLTKDFYTYSFSKLPPSSIIQSSSQFYCFSFSHLRFTEDDSHADCRLHVTAPLISPKTHLNSFTEEFKVTKSCPRKEITPTWQCIPEYFSGGTGLQFPFTPGDSGSPLLCKIGNTVSIVGVATRFQNVPDTNSQSYPPNSLFCNKWLSLYHYIPWITEILKEHGTNKLSDHPELSTNQ